MELKEKIQKLDLKPRNAPDGISPDKFGRWIRAVKAGGEINAIARTLLNLYCDSLLSSRITGEPCYKEVETKETPAQKSFLDGFKKMEAQNIINAAKPKKIQEKRSLLKKAPETPLKISKKKEKTKIIAVKIPSRGLENFERKDCTTFWAFRNNDETFKVPIETGLDDEIIVDGRAMRLRNFNLKKP